MDRSPVDQARDGAHRPTREPHVLEAPLLTFDLREEFERLRHESPYAKHRRNAKTLVKSEAFRLVAVALQAGVRFDEDDPRGHVGVAVHGGALTLHVGDDTSHLGAGSLAAIEPGHRWWATADENTLVVLHLSWPG